MMRVYTITNEYVVVYGEAGLIRCEVQGMGRNRYIELEGKAYLLSSLY